MKNVNCSNLISNKNYKCMESNNNSKKVKIKHSRTFLGKTDNFENNEDRRFNQRMLKAYLQGHKYFNYGFEVVMGKKQPKAHLVLQK